MSMTAQRQDISDPAVVDRFARAVGTQRRLEYLYVLTVADIAATRPKLWNSWKDSLLWELFTSATERLAEGEAELQNRAELAEEIRTDARSLLVERGHDGATVDALFDALPADGLVRLDGDQLAWSAARVLAGDPPPLVACRTLPDKGITEVFVYAEDFDGLFAITAREFDRMELNVLAARVATTLDGRSWNIFQLMDANAGCMNKSDSARLERALSRQLTSRDIRALPGRPIPRRLRHFLTRSDITLDSSGELTRLEIATTDRPGLLSEIAEALLEADLRLHDARIATFGQRVEDVFKLSGRNGGPLDEERASDLEHRLRDRLDPAEEPLGESP